MSGVIWVHQSEIPYSTVEAELRIKGKDYQGLVVFDCWYKKDELVGLPRYWAEKRGFTGNYSLAPCKWPEFSGKFRPQQKEKIDEILVALEREGTTLFDAQTGFGKTLVGCVVASKLQQKTLVIVNKNDLREQWIDSAKRFFGVDVCIFQGKKRELGCPITVATIQTLAQLPEPEILLGQFGLLIVDEAHTFSCPSFHAVMPYMDAQYRLGVSATFRRADKLEDVYERHLGVVTVSTQREYLPSSYKAPLIEFPIPSEDYTVRGELNHAQMLNAISRLQEYNEWLASIVKQCVDKSRKVLLVSHRIEQCKSISALLTNWQVEHRIYVGSTKKGALDEARKSGVILTTYSKFGTGTDAPELDTLILATPASDVEQVVGRITRVKEGKQKPLVIDPLFNHSYLMALGRKRAAIYERLGITNET